MKKLFLSVAVLGFSLCLFSQTKYDMWDWMINDHWATEHLNGGHRLQQVVNGDYLYMIKQSCGYPVEVYQKRKTLTEAIYMRFETGGYDPFFGGGWDDPYTNRRWEAGDYRWIPRYVTSGAVFHTSSFVQRYYDATCTYVKSDNLGYICKVVFKPAMKFYGDIGTRDAIELNAYWKGDPNEIDDMNKEVYYYTKEFGLVKYVDVENGAAKNTVWFNKRVYWTFPYYAPCWQED